MVSQSVSQTVVVDRSAYPWTTVTYLRDRVVDFDVANDMFAQLTGVIFPPHLVLLFEPDIFLFGDSVAIGFTIGILDSGQGLVEVGNDICISP
jgi:hypothetical protein